MQSSPGFLTLLPLMVAGFIFLVVCYPTRILIAHADGQRVFFSCGFAGLVLGYLVFSVYDSWLPSGLKIGVFSDDNRFIQNSGQIFLALLTAPALAYLVNFVLFIFKRLNSSTHQIYGSTWDWLFYRHAINEADPLSRLLALAAGSKGEKLVLISLSSRKVYCGAILRLPSAIKGADGHLEIIPKFSATRNKDTLTFEKRLGYPAFEIWRVRSREALIKDLIARAKTLGKHTDLENLHRELELIESFLAEVDSKTSPGYARNLVIEDWAKVIPFSEIETISFFDETSHAAFFPDSEQPAPP